MVHARPILSALRPGTADRFRAKLQPDAGCLVFTGAKHKQGYGMVDVMTGGKRTPILAHRLAYALVNGEPDPALVVCHRCHNPACCLPAHLYLGTQQDNMNDKLAAGRHRAGKPMLGRMGTDHPKAHTQAKRDEVFAVLAAQVAAGDGMNFGLASKATGVSAPTIGKWWKASL